MEVWEDSSLFPRRKSVVLHNQCICVNFQFVKGRGMPALLNRSWSYLVCACVIWPPSSDSKWGTLLGGGPLILGNLCSVTKHILFSSRKSPPIIQSREVRNSPCASQLLYQRKRGIDFISSLKIFLNFANQEHILIETLSFLPAKVAKKEVLPPL